MVHSEHLQQQCSQRCFDRFTGNALQAMYEGKNAKRQQNTNNREGESVCKKFSRLAELDAVNKQKYIDCVPCDTDRLWKAQRLHETVNVRVSGAKHLS